MDEYKLKLKSMTDEELKKEGERLFMMGRRCGFSEQTIYFSCLQDGAFTMEKARREN